MSNVIVWDIETIPGGAPGAALPARRIAQHSRQPHGRPVITQAALALAENIAEGRRLIDALRG
jgi:hypothetical protein